MFRYEYIHKEDTCFFVIERKDNDLYLCYADEQCCGLLGIKHTPGEQQCLRDFITPEEYNKVLDGSDKLGSEYKILKFTKNNLCQCNNSPCTITLLLYPCTEKKLFFGYCLQTIALETFPQKELSTDLSSAFYNASFDVLFTLQITNTDRLLLMNYNKTFLSYFNMTREYDSNHTYSDMGAILPPQVVNFFAENTKLALSQGIAFSRLLDYEYTTHDREFCFTPSKNRCMLLVTFLPLSKQEFSSVLCCARDLTSEMEAKNQTAELLEEYNALFSATSNAVAIFSCANLNHPVLEKQNTRMQSLRNEVEMETFTNLFQSYFWSKAIETKSTVEEMFTLQGTEQTYHFKIVIIPIIRNGIITKVIISIHDTTEQVITNIRNSIKLSNREQEVISYAIAGEKNDFIAAKLCISVGTVKRTLSNAYSKLGISSRVELINYYHNRHFDTNRPHGLV